MFFRSSSKRTKPLVPSTDRHSPSRFAQLMWVEPGPWQASHETFISDQVVEYVSDPASYCFFKFVE
jgi:hypothetical protein